MEIVKKAIIKQGGVSGKAGMVGGPEGLLAKMIPFDSQGAMKARRFRGAPLGSPSAVRAFDGPWGRLERSHTLMDPLYVVWSYSTPIAFVKACGTIEIPDERYSVTTSHHQNMCRAWMGRGTVWSDQDKTNILWVTQAVRDAEKGVWV